MAYYTEPIPLPSHGWYYDPSNPLYIGTIDLRYMTAADEDILSSKNLIMKGVAVDKLMEALIASPQVKYRDLLIGDKNALMIASRIMGYGKTYETTCECPQCAAKTGVEINLEQLKPKVIELDEKMRGKNEFELELPACKKRITFKLLTQGDDENIRREIDSLRKGIKSEITREVTTRMRYSVLSVDGDRDREVVRKFIDEMPARDAQTFREYARKVNPDIDLTFDFECPKCGYEARVEVPIDVTFFWPYARV